MGSKTILYVDDDALMRKLVVAALTKPHLSVIASSDGFEALRVLAEHPIDLLITDIRMPGMNGFELARRAKLARADLKIIYISAHFSDAERANQVIHGVLMDKPVNPSDLRREVDQLIGPA